jgi:quercetin dioxygenase-like cupin family protein
LSACTVCRGECAADIPGQPSTAEFRCGNLFVLQISVASAGTLVPQHSHVFDHVTFLAAGSVRLHRLGVEPMAYAAPVAIHIPAFVKHAFETLTDGVTLLCIHDVSATGRIDVAEEHQLACP